MFKLNFLKSENKKITNWIVFSLSAVHIAFVYLIATGVAPGTIYIYFAAIISALLIALPSSAGAIILISQLPFFLVLPQLSQTFSLWRLGVGVLFVRFCIEAFKDRGVIFQKFKGFSIYNFRYFLTLPAFWFIALYVWAVLSLAWAQFPIVGLKQLLFVLNGLLLFTVLYFQQQTDYKLRLLKATAISTSVLVGIGFFQFVLTFIMEQYFFWQYWATMVSKTYYGEPIARVLTYSNSWFTVSGGVKTLRMFGVLPDSHSFGLIAVYSMYAWLPFVKSEKQTQRILSRLLIFFAAFGLVLSGTRGVWAGMLAPLAIVCISWFFNFAPRVQLKKVVKPIAVVLVIFVLSPLINMGFNLIRSGFSNESFIERASTIYDLNESSNVGRLDIWKSSLVYSLKHPGGTGQGNFITSLSEGNKASSFEELGEVHNKKYNLPLKYITAHSLYLQILVELGICGFIIFIGFCLASLYKLYLRLHKTGADVITSSITVVVLWILAYSVFDVTILNDRVMLYTLTLLSIL